MNLSSYNPNGHCWGCGEDAEGRESLYLLHYNTTGREVERRFCSKPCAAAHARNHDAVIVK